MSSTWSYAPITIHLDNQNHNHPHQPQSIALSGIYLENNITKKYYVLTINDVDNPYTYHYKFTNSEFISPTTITWLPLTLLHVRYLNEENKKHSSLMNFLNGLMINEQFRFKPYGHDKLSILVFKLTPNFKPDDQPLFQKNALKPINFLNANEVEIPTKIQISCCPFSLTNAAIFSDYQMYGSLNFRIRDTGYLTDVKYLDDVIGGVVNQNIDNRIINSIGLVAGCLSKVNGDGDLMVIISWNKIFQLLGYNDLKVSSLITSNLTESIIESYDPIESVVRISVRSDHGNFWGSGIVLSYNYIITNLHVLKLETLEDFRISIPKKPDLVISLKDVTTIKCPLEGFDLCFLKLNNPIYSLTPVTRLNTFQDPLYIGRKVKSVGYGLFHTDDKDHLKPFHSEGFVNRIVSLDLDDSGNNLVDSLLLASASCWNGSSGGGLFNESNKLIGIMTSNGRLSSGEIITTFTLAIPINIIEKALFMIENNLKPINVQKKVQDVWSLKNTHNNVKYEPVSYKL